MIGAYGQRPGLAEGFQARGIVLAGSLLERLHGGVKKFVDQPAGERFNHCYLLRAERTQVSLRALKLCLTNLLGLSLQSNDGRSDVDSKLPLLESLDQIGRA